MADRLLGSRRFRCDDAGGFELLVVRANDGDFHVSVVPHRDDFKREHEGEEQHFAGCYGASVRIRAPMAGGGSHEVLWYALVKLFAPAQPTPSPDDARREPTDKPCADPECAHDFDDHDNEGEIVGGQCFICPCSQFQFASVAALRDDASE